MYYSTPQHFPDIKHKFIEENTNIKVRHPEASWIKIKSTFWIDLRIHPVCSSNTSITSYKFDTVLKAALCQMFNKKNHIFLWQNIACKRYTDIHLPGHSFPLDFCRGRTFVHLLIYHPGHSFTHTIVTPDICSARYLLPSCNLIHLLFDVIPSQTE